MRSKPLLAWGCVISVFLLTTSCRIIPPEAATLTRLGVTKVRIQEFWTQHGRVPMKPIELPDKKNYDCSITDGWGRELHWESNGTNKVRIWSLGRDGKLGGTGEDADMESVFVGQVPKGLVDDKN